MDKIPMTAAGYSVLETSSKHRQQHERPDYQQITDALSHGDLSENASTMPRRNCNRTRGRIAELEDKLARAEVIDVSSFPAIPSSSARPSR
jgi:transcription elongation factor GreA